MKLAFFILFCFASSLLYSQNAKEIFKEEGVVINASWSKFKDKKKKELDMVNLEVENTTTDNLQVEFTLAFMLNNEPKMKSPTIKACVKPGKKVKGKKAGLSFTADELKTEEINSDKFKLDVENFEVKKVKKCK